MLLKRACKYGIRLRYKKNEMQAHVDTMKEVLYTAKNGLTVPIKCAAQHSKTKHKV